MRIDIIKKESPKKQKESPKKQKKSPKKHGGKIRLLGSGAKMDILIDLKTNKPSQVKIMSKNLFKSQANCSVDLNQLYDAGFVTRKQEKTDKRLIVYSINPEAIEKAIGEILKMCLPS
jgi:DNA-binding MarR family transcriptional regulator